MACALCSSYTDASSDKKRRKLLYGKSCADELAILKSEIARVKNTCISRIRQLVNPSVYLCLQCQKLLLKKKQLKGQLADISKTIESRLQSMEVIEDVMQVESRKRTLSEASSEDHQICSLSPDLIVMTRDKTSCKTRQTLITPTRKPVIRSLTRRSYKAASLKFTKLPRTSDYLLKDFVNKINKEIVAICSLKHNSVLRGNHTTLKTFSWSKIWHELGDNVPTLIKLFQNLLPKAERKFICYLTSMILKKRCVQMSLIQRAVSFFLYANGTNKEVFTYLQPFMVCMAPSTTNSIVDKLIDGYDADVLKWAKDVARDTLSVSEQSSSNELRNFLSISDDIFDDDDNNDDTWSTCSSVYSVGEVSLILEGDGDGTELGTDNQNVAGDIIVGTEVELIDTDIPYEEVQNEGEIFVGTKVDENSTNLQDKEETNVGTEIDQEGPRSETIQISDDTETQYSSCNPGFVLVIDNIDLNVRRSDQRVNRTTSSYHFCHAFALLNRVNSTHLADQPPSGVLSLDLLLPTKADLDSILKEFQTFVSRMLVKHMSEFSDEKEAVEWYIPSIYVNEMSAQSVVVPLGIQTKNEANIKEMEEILDGLGVYIPVKSLPDAGDIYKIPRIIYGDQLTVARIRGAVTLRCSDVVEDKQLKGFTEVISDWHTRLCLVTTIVDRSYSSKSSADKGTLFQLRQLVHRTSFGKEPKNNMKATEDFLELVLIAHVIAATKNLQETSSNTQRCTDLAKQLVTKFITISVPNLERILSKEKSTEDTAQDVGNSSEVMDSVYSYAVDILTMGLLWYGFRDAVREGDDNRITLYWKFLMPVFRQEKHYNYANEGFLLLTQTLLLSPRQLCDLKWNRTVNTTGHVGKNIPVDLHMEHLNRRLKIMIRRLGSNVSPSTVIHASKALAVVDTVRLQFLKDDQESHVENKDYHTVPSIKKDLDMIEQQLTSEKVFDQTKKRQHKTYQNYKPLLQSINWKNVCKWCKDKTNNYSTY